MRKIEKSTNIYREHVDVIMDVILLWGDGELLYVYSHRKYVYPIYLALLIGKIYHDKTDATCLYDPI